MIVFLHFAYFIWMRLSGSIMYILGFFFLYFLSLDLGRSFAWNKISIKCQLIASNIQIELVFFLLLRTHQNVYNLNTLLSRINIIITFFCLNLETASCLLYIFLNYFIFISLSFNQSAQMIFILFFIPFGSKKSVGFCFVNSIILFLQI